MQNRSFFLVLIFFLFLGSYGASANTLKPGAGLSMGQAIQSLEAKYVLAMQADGNLVMYRNDGSVRWTSRKSSHHVTMQEDGNLVQYSAMGVPQWHTQTWGNPGAYLALQDDGNLVVYSTQGKGALWHIGAEPPSGEPYLTGDVVGRNLNWGLAGSLGHIGLWDGVNVTDVVSGRANAVRTVSLDFFRNETSYWGSASPNIPSGATYSCFEVFCSWYPSNGGYTYQEGRVAIAKRARQIAALGASYDVFSANYVPSRPSDEYNPAVRGIYRCDTFVLDAYRYSTFHQKRNEAQTIWKNRVDSLWNKVLPREIFDKLKTFN